MPSSTLATSARSYALQDLHLEAVDHGQDPPDGTYIAAIPAGLIAHHRISQSIDHFGRGCVIHQQIQVPGLDRQSMQG